MSLEAVFADLHRRNIELFTEGPELRFRAPRGALTPADRETLGQRRAEILKFLQQESHSPSRPSFHGDEAVATEVRRSRKQHAVDEPDLERASQKSHNSQKAAQGAAPSDSANCANCANRWGTAERGGLLIDPLPSPVGKRVVTMSGRTYPYFVWDGRVLGGAQIGFDTETTLIVANEVPALALASASSGAEHCLIHPDRLGAFIRLHKDRHLVFHKVAFDFWVVVEHLAARGEAEALEIWWAIADTDRMHDTMLLDELIRLARTDAYPRQRDLAEVVREYAGLEIDKTDPYRLRYAELIGRDWATVERGFFEYAVKDPIATLAAYEAMYPKAIELMESYRYDPSRCR
jgi:hypothetical protein